MLTFSPFLLLIPYGIVVAVIGFFSLMNIGHLFRTGTATFVSFVFTFVFLFYSFAVLAITYNSTSAFDWKTPIKINFSSFEIKTDSFTE